MLRDVTLASSSSSADHFLQILTSKNCYKVYFSPQTFATETRKQAASGAALSETTSSAPELSNRAIEWLNGHECSVRSGAT